MDRYETRILRVLEALHRGPLSLDEAAELAALSRFHFHRVFRAVSGETLAQAARRTRLTLAAMRLAAMRLAAGGTPAQAAADAGYADLSAFTRAFRVAYGRPPSAFAATSKGDPTMYPTELRENPARRLAGLPHRGDYTQIGRTFEKVSAMISARGLWPVARGMAGAYYDDPSAVPEPELRALAGILLADGADLPEGLEPLDLPAGRFAVLTHTGPYATLPPAYDWFYGTWLAEQRIVPTNVPPLEVYLNSPLDTAPDDLKTEIQVGIQVS